MVTLSIEIEETILQKAKQHQMDNFYFGGCSYCRSRIIKCWLLCAIK